MEDFGRTREEWLKQFLELPNGIPDSGTFRRVFERLNPKELSQCLSNWLEVEHRKRSVVAVDGRTICWSANAEHKAYQVVSAFVTENQITSGEIAVLEKTNEITAIPKLLDLVNIKGHGRTESREYRFLTDTSWLDGRKEWKGLKAVGEAKRAQYMRKTPCGNIRDTSSRR